MVRFLCATFVWHCLLICVNRWICAARIQSEWARFGVTCNTEDVKSVVAALDGTGKCVRLVACGTTRFFFFSGSWTKSVFTNGDILRLHLACEVMEIDARKSIFYAAQNAFGENRIHTNMYVIYMFCFLCVIKSDVCRYNVYKRVETLVQKMISNKKISLEATFLPKRKRVLNKKHTRVLNKPVKRAKAKKKEVDAVLDSQVSISCLLYSQASQPPSSPSINSPVSSVSRMQHTYINFFISGQWACISSTESEFAGLSSAFTKFFTKLSAFATSYMFTTFASDRLPK